MSNLTINYLAYRLIKEDGYGRYGVQQIRALHKAGVDVYPDTVATLEMPTWMQRLRGLDLGKLTISLMPPHELPGFAGRQWNSTMYESSGIPDGWAEHVNRKAERLIVPSPWMIDVFRAAGVKKSVPIDVIPGGVCVEEFPVHNPPVTDRPYTFLAFGDRGTRKGFDTAYQAFYRAFGDHPDVRLIVKSRPMNLRELTTAGGDRRVSLWREDVTSLAEVFTLCDCFVFPTKGEGWGLPPREAACTGKPVITTRWSGTADGIDHWAIPINTYTLVPASIPGGGVWARPNVNEVAQHMRWCYESREDARQLGLRAAQWLRDNQSWDHSAQALIELIETWG